jgi:hypothetical protein
MVEMTLATLQSVEDPGDVEVLDDFEMCFASVVGFHGPL